MATSTSNKTPSHIEQHLPQVCKNQQTSQYAADFKKKSCATFSSTLRNFQDDYLQEQFKFENKKRNNLSIEDEEESIHEEILD